MMELAKHANQQIQKGWRHLVQNLSQRNRKVPIDGNVKEVRKEKLVQGSRLEQYYSWGNCTGNVSIKQKRMGILGIYWSMSNQSNHAVYGEYTLTQLLDEGEKLCHNQAHSQSVKNLLHTDQTNLHLGPGSSTTVNHPRGLEG